MKTTIFLLAVAILTAGCLFPAFADGETLGLHCGIGTQGILSFEEIGGRKSVSFHPDVVGGVVSFGGVSPMLFGALRMYGESDLFLLDAGGGFKNLYADKTNPYVIAGSWLGSGFGIVGPNGAGKTTTVECLIGLRTPDGGEIRVLGMDPRTRSRVLRDRIGVQLQQAALPADIKVREALELFASFYSRRVDGEELLVTWGLAAKRQARFAALSGGQQQRLFIALALVNDPEIVFLDELTAGLDPQARRGTWEMIAALRDRGVTVVLVTHSMEEAEVLCGRVAIMDRGRLAALDTPQRLIAALDAETRVRFTLAGSVPPGIAGLPGVAGVEKRGDAVTVSGRGALLARVASALAAEGIVPADLRVERASLEDVFLALTGRKP